MFQLSGVHYSNTGPKTSNAKRPEAVVATTTNLGPSPGPLSWMVVGFAVVWENDAMIYMSIYNNRSGIGWHRYIATCFKLGHSQKGLNT